MILQNIRYLYFKQARRSGLIAIQVFYSIFVVAYADHKNCTLPAYYQRSKSF